MTRWAIQGMHGFAARPVILGICTPEGRRHAAWAADPIWRSDEINEIF
jgi:hypothetical protein